MNITVIMSVRNPLRYINKTFTPLKVQLGSQDQLIVVDYGSKDGTNRDSFPNTIDYFKVEGKHETEVLNDLVEKHVKCDHVLFLDGNYAIDKNYIKNIKSIITLNPTSVIIGNIDDDVTKQLECVNTTCISCCMSNVCFPKSDLLKFETEVKDFNNNIHGIALCKKLEEQNISILYSKTLSAIRVGGAGFRDANEEVLESMAIISGLGGSMLRKKMNQHVKPVRPSSNEKPNVPRTREVKKEVPKKIPRHLKVDGEERGFQRDVRNAKKRPMDSGLKVVPSPEDRRASVEGRKPRILFITDVEGWAWWLKSHYIKKHLEDDFIIDVTSVHGSSRSLLYDTTYDLYFTFGYGNSKDLCKFPYHKRITGVTAHRNIDSIMRSMSLCYATHANSMLLLKQLRGVHDNCFYVPNGVDTDLFYPKTEPLINKSFVTFGHVGKLSPKKGQLAIIEPACKMAEVKYFSHYNTWVDPVRHEDMIDVYQNLDVMIVASDEDGTPNPALEAAACGRPIISNKIGNMPEFIVDGYNGFLVEKKIGAYVEKIKWFKANPEKVVEMGKNARQTAIDGWTWKIQSENYRKMFWKLLGFEK